jgi:hypothetical protein
MPGLFIALMLSQAAEPGALVLVTRRVSVAPKVAADAARDVRLALATAGVLEPIAAEETTQRLLALGVRDPTRCEAKKACIVEFGRQLHVQNIVSLDLAPLGKDVLIHAEAYRVADEVRLAEQTSVVPFADLSTLPIVFEPFAGKLRAVLGPSAQPLAAAPAEPSPAIVVAPRPAPRPGPRLLPIVAGGLALMAGGFAAVLAGLGFDQKATLEARDQAGAAVISRMQADELAASANTRLTLALVCGVTAGLFAVLAAVLFGAGP